MTQRNKEKDTGRNSEGMGLGFKKTNLLFENQIASSNWLTTKEAAKYLRTSPNQVRNWVYQGKVRAYKLLGKSLRFKSTELDFLHQGGRSWE